VRTRPADIRPQDRRGRVHRRRGDIPARVRRWDFGP